MKTQIRFTALIMLIGLGGFVACRKSISEIDPVVQPPAQTNEVPYPQTWLTGCAGSPDYGDSIIFIQPASTDYIVTPINHPDSGQYFAWPEGMVIDRHTGAINVSKSEGGLRYNIGYVKNGTTDTCLQTLILAGASYADSVYVLGNDERYAKPYYNADPNLVNVCSGSGVPGGGTCAFDINGNAASQQIKIDNNIGYIDLKNTLEGGAFGLVPKDGDVVNTTIAYKLDDKSNLATQYIPVTMVYYTHKSDVPPGLVSLIGQKLDKILNEVLLINIFNSGSTFSKANPRPPIIVVTRFN